MVRGSIASPSPGAYRIPYMLHPQLTLCPVTRLRLGVLLSVGGGGTALARAGGQGRCLFSGPSRQGCTCRPRTKGTPVSRPPGHCTPGPGPISVTAGESLGGLGPRTPGCRGSGLFCPPHPHHPRPVPLSLRPGSTSVSRCVSFAGLAPSTGGAPLLPERGGPQALGAGGRIYLFLSHANASFCGGD